MTDEKQVQPCTSPEVEDGSESPPHEEEVYSIYRGKSKTFIVVAASIASLFSPLSANIYLPALNTIADQLHVSNTLINLTVTTYMVWISEPSMKLACS